MYERYICYWFYEEVDPTFDDVISDLTIVWLSSWNFDHTYDDYLDKATEIFEWDQDILHEFVKAKLWQEGHEIEVPTL